MKILTIHLKKRHLVLGTGLLLAALLLLAPAARSAAAAAVKRQIPIYCVQKDSPVIAISFDAAWGADDTRRLIQILDRYQIKTTFFAVGDWVDHYPEQVKALAAAGHEVMNHSDSHPHMSKLSRDQILQEINHCSDKIEGLTGTRPTLFRAPYGEYNDAVIEAARAAGCRTVQWDVDSLDWKEKGVEHETARVLDRVQPGSIVLFHNNAKYTPEALPGILDGLLQKGYSIVPVSQLILQGPSHIDHTGRQIPD